MSAVQPALRWVVAPGETGRAWRAAVVSGVTSPREALALVGRSIPAQAPSLPRAVPAPELPELPELPPIVDMHEVTDPERLRMLVEAPAPAPAGPDLAPLFEAAPAVGGDLVFEVEDQALVPDPAERNVRAELARCDTKRAALLVAWDHLGVRGVPTTAEVMPAVEWLAARGVQVDRSGAYEVRRRVAAREVAAVSAEASTFLALRPVAGGVR